MSENKDVYRFWAVFSNDVDGVSVSFPDLPGCLTCGDTAEEAHVNAKDALGGFLLLMEQDNEEIPAPTSMNELIGSIEKNEVLVDVQIYMPTLRDALENKAIKKTLTVPKWLNDAAERQNINFSQVLQEGLKRSLGIDKRRAK